MKKGLNKFDSIPVEASDILQAVKNLNFVNSATRKESFFRIRKYVTPKKLFIGNFIIGFQLLRGHMKLGRTQVKNWNDF